MGTRSRGVGLLLILSLAIGCTSEDTTTLSDSGPDLPEPTGTGGVGDASDGGVGPNNPDPNGRDDGGSGGEGGNPAVATMGPDCEGDFVVTGPEEMAAIAGCVTISGFLEVEYWANEHAFELPLLEEAGWVEISRENSGLTLVDLPKLSRTDLRVASNDKLEELRIPRVSAVEILGNDVLARVDLSMASWLWELYIKNNPQLLSVNVSALADVELLNVSGNHRLPALELPQLLSATEIVIANNLNLETLALPAFVEIFRDIRVTDNPVLTELRFPKFERTADPDVQTMLYFADNATLERLSFPLLVDAGTVLSISRNPSLRMLELPMLEGHEGSYGGTLFIGGNGRLPLVALPRLLVLGDILEVSDNAVLAELLVPSLTRVHDFRVYDNPALPMCQATQIIDALEGPPAYETVESNLGAAGCP